MSDRYLTAWREHNQGVGDTMYAMRAIIEITSRPGENPTPAEVARRLGWSEAALYRVMDSPEYAALSRRVHLEKLSTSLSGKVLAYWERVVDDDSVKPYLKMRASENLWKAYVELGSLLSQHVKVNDDSEARRVMEEYLAKMNRLKVQVHEATGREYPDREGPSEVDDEGRGSPTGEREA